MSDLETKDITNRILKTLELAEERGYNLTLEQLSAKMIGGVVNKDDLISHINKHKAIESDETFIATKGNLKSDKCKKRKINNLKLQPYYKNIAQEFTNDFKKICPWVRCILVSGSTASEGLTYGEDIDFDIIVQNNHKYLSYLLAILLSFKYSIKYGKRFWKRYVICISVIWEEHQVFPFQRRDAQLAFELLNSKVIYNKSYFNHVLSENIWIKDWFPQMFKFQNDFVPKNFLQEKKRKRYVTHFLECMSREIMFFIVDVARKTIFKDHDMQRQMSIKYPYSILDIPSQFQDNFDEK